MLLKVRLFDERGNSSRQMVDQPNGLDTAGNYLILAIVSLAFA